MMIIKGIGEHERQVYYTALVRQYSLGSCTKFNENFDHNQMIQMIQVAGSLVALSCNYNYVKIFCNLQVLLSFWSVIENH